MSYRPRYLIEFVPYTYFVANKKMVTNTYIVNAHFITTFIVLTRKSLPIERLMSPLTVEIVYSQNAMTHYNGYLVDLMTHTYRIQRGL